MKAGGWKLEAGGWRLEAGHLKLELEAGRLEAGGWRLEAAGWRLEAGKLLFNQCLKIGPVPGPKFGPEKVAQNSGHKLFLCCPGVF